MINGVEHFIIHLLAVWLSSPEQWLLPGPVAGEAGQVSGAESMEMGMLLVWSWDCVQQTCHRMFAFSKQLFSILALIWSSNPPTWIPTLPQSVQFRRSAVSNSLWPHGLQHARPPCPSPTPRVHPNPCPLSQWCHPTISSSVVTFSSRLQSVPASGSFPMRASWWKLPQRHVYSWWLPDCCLKREGKLRISCFIIFANITLSKWHVLQKQKRKILQFIWKQTTAYCQINPVS